MMARAAWFACLHLLAPSKIQSWAGTLSAGASIQHCTPRHLEAHTSSSHIVLEGAIGQAAHNVGVHHSPGQLDLPRGAVFSAPDMRKHLSADDLQQVQGVVLG